MKKKILVIYYTGGIYPIRDTIEKHLYSWRRYSKYDIMYVNAAFPVPIKILQKVKIDAVVFHTIFLGSMRWNKDLYSIFSEKFKYLKLVECVKIAIPQDEFLNTEILNNFINEFGVTDILTCSNRRDWNYIYNKVDKKKVKFRTVLTGYIDEETVQRVNNLSKNIGTRDIDIGYRAWKAEYWLGELGTYKVIVANECMKLAKRLGLKVDISLNDSDTFHGDEWFKFLLKCKSTVGVEGGASVLDRYGDIRVEVNKYVKDHPNATFQEVRKKYFDKKDGRLHLACISPRHLEACITKTCQFLIEGTYSGILKPWEHFIPIKRDFSNLKKVLALLKNTKYIQKITEAAYKDIIQSNKYTYRKFIKTIESDIIEKSENKRVVNSYEILYVKLINLLDVLNWLKIKYDVKKTNIIESLIIKCLRHGYKIFKNH